MKIGEEVTISRLPSGLYKISRKQQPLELVGGAASTICALSMVVFQDEAGETPEYVTPTKK